MSRHLTIAALLSLTLALHPRPAGAFGNANAKVLLHLHATPEPRNECTDAAAAPPCSGVITSGGLYPLVYYAHVLVEGGDPVDGVGSVVLGIEYGSAQGDEMGVDIFSWSRCATLELPATPVTWPASGSSNRLIWDTTGACQRNEPGGAGTGVVANAGYFYCAAYSASTLRVTYFHDVGEPGDGQVIVTNCNGHQADIIDEESSPHSPSPLGTVRFSDGATEPGYNPCAAIPVEPVTWSRIKALSTR